MAQKSTRHIRFLALYEPVHSRFERFCRARCYGEMEPEDLINETLLLAYEKLDNLRADAAFLSFLFGISVRILANDKRKMRPESSEKIGEFGPFSTAQSPEQAADVHYLHQALAELPLEQREALILFEISGFSVKEVAEIQEVSEDAIKQRLRRGRQGLREILNYESVLKTGEEG